MEQTNVIILGGGTAASNAARAAMATGAQRVVLVHPIDLINTCVEEGCMPSKSILAGAHRGESLETVMQTRDAHITRLRNALTEGFTSDNIEIIHGMGQITGTHEVTVTTPSDEQVVFQTDSIIIATGSHSFVPPIPGLDPADPRIMISDDVVSRKHTITEVPGRILTIGAGPIGLELSTFFHDMGSHVEVLQRGPLLRTMDPEFGDERLRASQDEASFPITCHAHLTAVEAKDDGLHCTITEKDTQREEVFDVILVATGRKPNTASIGLETAAVALDERGNIVHDDQMRTSINNIFVAGDVTGHHQILHYAAEMGKVAGHNAGLISTTNNDYKDGPCKEIDYPRHMLAVSFDQFPSALIGLTETAANAAGIKTISAIRNFNAIGLGILKRQEYGLWKLVAEKSTGRIIGAQVLGPDSAGELVQLTVPIIHNKNTAADIMDMTWYHPTYAEILLSLAREIEKKR